MTEPISITVKTLVEAPADRVWDFWTKPEHITQWNNASPDWHTPRASVDLREGGTFNSRMEAKDGSVGFDFNGVFTKLIPGALIEYTMEGGRTVSVAFENQGGATHVMETFEAENENPVEVQRQGWQSILDNFKRYAESHA